MTSKLIEKCKSKNVNVADMFGTLKHLLTDESKKDVENFISKYSKELKEKTLGILKSDIFEGTGSITVEKDFIKVEQHYKIESIERWHKIVTVDLTNAIDEIVTLLAPPLNFWMSCSTFKRDFTPAAVEDLLGLQLKANVFENLTHAEIGYKYAYANKYDFNIRYEF